MHESWFTYNVARPYPFRWFTPLALAGGIVFTIFFSVVNYAVDGFYQTTILTTDPNSTLTEKHWWSPLEWGSRIQSSCQPLIIPIGQTFFTTNQGLSYSLKSVSSYDPATQYTVQYPSLPYLNHTLENCQTDAVNVYLAKADLSLAGYGAWWSWDNSYGTALAHCEVQTGLGKRNISFSTTYQDVGRKSYDYVIQDNYTTHASVWWGTRLANLYWNGILVEMGAMSAADGNNETSYTKGQITHTLNRTNDIKAYDFFDLQYFFLASNTYLWNTVDALDEMYNNEDPSYPFSGTLTEAMLWSKIMASLIHVDLGQTHISNLLLNTNLLQWILSGVGDAERQYPNFLNVTSYSSGSTDWSYYSTIAAPGDDPASSKQTFVNESYVAFKDKMGPLGTKNTTIYSQYACSVPIRKSTGTLLLAIVVADLVFLQALWKVLNLAAHTLLTHQQTEYGVAKRISRDGATEFEGSMVRLVDLNKDIKSRPISKSGTSYEPYRSLEGVSDSKSRDSLVSYDSPEVREHDILRPV